MEDRTEEKIRFRDFPENKNSKDNPLWHFIGTFHARNTQLWFTEKNECLFLLSFFWWSKKGILWWKNTKEFVVSNLAMGFLLYNVFVGISSSNLLFDTFNQHMLLHWKYLESFFYVRLWDRANYVRKIEPLGVMAHMPINTLDTPSPVHFGFKPIKA